MFSIVGLDAHGLKYDRHGFGELGDLRLAGLVNDQILSCQGARRIAGFLQEFLGPVGL